MSGSPTFSTLAQRALAAAYRAQPAGSRDLRRVLAQAKRGELEGVDPDLQREIATMSQAQAYEFARPRYSVDSFERVPAGSLAQLLDTGRP